MNKRSLVLSLCVFTKLDVSVQSLYLGRFILDELRKMIFSSLHVKSAHWGSGRSQTSSSCLKYSCFCRDFSLLSLLLYPCKLCSHELMSSITSFRSSGMKQEVYFVNYVHCWSQKGCSEKVCSSNNLLIINH